MLSEKTSFYKKMYLLFIHTHTHIYNEVLFVELKTIKITYILNIVWEITALEEAE